MRRCRTAHAPMPPRRAARAALPLPDCVALVLQGGGALGSYQAGVIEALAEAGIEIDWVAGISIGAINAAIIAGNPPRTPRRAAARLLGHGDRRRCPASRSSRSDQVRECVHEWSAGVGR